MSAQAGAQLVEIARRSIEHQLQTGQPLALRTQAQPQALRTPRATFVTLRSKGGALRGCIGELEARLPLAQSVAEVACNSAFRDPRFSPLGEQEIADLEIEIAVLGPLEPMTFRNELDLVKQLRPGIDGLVLREGSSQGTYLPSVWESLPDAAEFVVQLKRKAGLSPGHWSASVEVYRFEVQKLSSANAGLQSPP